MAHKSIDRMMNKILTIAIPTYNRPQQIKRQVELLLPQLTEEVELLVLDNHSPIAVDTLFNDSQLEKFTLIRNHVNIGADANIAKCYDLCRTKWLITLGDDDPVEDNAIATILNDIKSSDSETIFLNYDPKTKYSARGLEEFATHSLHRYWCLFWMSACVYNLELLKDNLHQYFYSISTMQPGIVLLVNSLADHPNYQIKVLGKSIHKLAGPDIQWNRDSFIYASLFVFDILRKYRKILDKTLFKSICGLLYRHTITLSKNERSRLRSFKLIFAISQRRGIKRTLSIDFHWFIRAIYHCLLLK